jgi:origin recognition complex subunit 3
MRCIQTFLERQGYKGLQWSADPHKNGGLCEAMVDVLRGNVGRDVKHLGMLTKSVYLLSLPAFRITDILLYCIRKLKLNQLHGVLEELLNFFDAPSRILPEEQEARATIALFQSLLSDDD